MCNKVEINQENPEILLAVYGTLRVSYQNYDRFLKNKSVYLGTIRTAPKFTMWGKNMYFPIVTTNGDTSIECDIIKIRVNGVLQKIHDLEGCTGIPNHSKNWYNIMPMETEFGTAYMYVQEGEFPEMGIISSGNWKNKNLE